MGLVIAVIRVFTYRLHIGKESEITHCQSITTCRELKIGLPWPRMTTRTDGRGVNLDQL